MKKNKTNNRTSNGYVIYWDRVIVALAIFLIVIIGCVSMIVYIASGSKKAETTNLTEKKIEGSTYGEEAEEPVVEEEAAPLFKVFIDAGHGGDDGGCSDIGETRLEKDDNLRVALLVKEKLEEYGVEVVMTRESDETVSLDDRCDMANRSNADLFVSLHRNSATVGQGVEIWVSNKEIYEDTLLGENIMAQLDGAGISENRGVQFGYIGNPRINYQVNYDTDMPSCLVELGFVTDDEDNELFDKNIENYAQAIADGIYKTGIDLKL